MLSKLLPPEWRNEKLSQPSVWERIESKLNQSVNEIAPPRELIFAALTLPPSAVKTIIIGQDPYPTPGDAVGLAFSVNRRNSLPPTLRNIFKEYQSDTGFPPPVSGDLSTWRDRGVLLLNRTLTCDVGATLSHDDCGWEIITDEIIAQAANAGATAILWGKHAQRSAHLFPNRAVISPHPSPLSAYRGFFGSRPFTRTNTLLESLGREAIDWKLPDASQEID